MLCGGAVLSRTTRVVASSTCWGWSATPSASMRSMRRAAAVIAPSGWRMVVSGGVAQAAIDVVEADQADVVGGAQAALADGLERRRTPGCRCRHDRGRWVGPVQQAVGQVPAVGDHELAPDHQVLVHREAGPHQGRPVAVQPRVRGPEAVPGRRWRRSGWCPSSARCRVAVRLPCQFVVPTDRMSLPGSLGRVDDDQRDPCRGQPLPFGRAGQVEHARARRRCRGGRRGPASR